MYWELEPKPQVQLWIRQHSAKRFHLVQIAVGKKDWLKILRNIHHLHSTEWSSFLFPEDRGMDTDSGEL